MTVEVKSLYTPGGKEDRIVAYVEVTIDNVVYEWKAYVPVDRAPQEYVEEIEAKLVAEIQAKDAEWIAIKDSTEVTKEEIVKPDETDYYAARVAEYPSIESQLDALWKGVGSPEYQAMLDIINAIKAKYPKPTVTGK